MPCHNTMNPSNAVAISIAVILSVSVSSSTIVSNAYASSLHASTDSVSAQLDAIITQLGGINEKLGNILGPYGPCVRPDTEKACVAEIDATEAHLDWTTSHFANIQFSEGDLKDPIILGKLFDVQSQANAIMDTVTKTSATSGTPPDESAALAGIVICSQRVLSIVSGLVGGGTGGTGGGV